MSDPPRLSETSRAVEILFRTADEHAEGFRKSAGMSCPSGCGACCSRPGGVEARVAEMLPAAFALLAVGGADAPYELALADPDGRCVFFVPTSVDGASGSCAHYAVRPGLCRLFGYAGRHDKYGAMTLATCSVLKTETLMARVATGELLPPLMSSVGDGVTALVGARSGLGELLPINRALTAAMTRAFFASEEGPGSIEPVTLA